MAKEVTTGDWERNYREKHLLFLLKDREEDLCLKALCIQI